MKIYISKKDYEKLYSVGNDNYPEKYQLTAIYPEKGTQSFCGYTTHCKRPVEIKVLPEMTQEQIERLREWHKLFMGEFTASKGKIYHAQRMDGFLSGIEIAIGEKTSISNDGHKIYLNGKLISEVKL